jgi:hypothetical protein
MTKIYLVENIEPGTNKVYIGKTKGNWRKSQHKRKYGSQIIYKEIDIIDSSNKVDWKPIETKWIQHYRDLGYIVLNENNGGGGLVSHTEESKQKIKNKKTGTFHSEQTKQKIGSAHFGLKYNITKKGKEHKSYHVSKPKGFGLKITNNTNRSKNISKSRQKPIQQCDLNNNIIKEWVSSKEAGSTLNINKSNITQCCKGKQKTYKGYKWKYKS